VSLQEYKRKRRFDRTPEPSSEGSARTGTRPIFVVQLHHASRRHYDFRLQVGDALKSWSVPKGPSYDPSVKRLAVEVEDHPVSYADFQGDIPEGYGAGHVDTFDRGYWSTPYDPEAQLEKGHLQFELYGERLKGAWHLVRSGKPSRQPTWFLFHDKDQFAGKLEADDLLDARMVASTRAAAGKSGGAKEVAEKLARTRRKSPPKAKGHRHTKAVELAAAAEGARKAKIDAEFFEPELARLKDDPPTGEHWLHEVKWDGYRILTAIADGEVHLWSRNALPWDDKIPDILQAVQSLELNSARLDGELIALDADGQPDFNGLQRTLSGEANAPLAYMLFDLPYLEGWDLSRTPLIQRKAVLEALLEDPPAHLSYSSHVVGNGAQVFAAAAEQKLEGIISKRADSPYRGGRGDDWLKIKRLEADEFAVVGYTPAKGGREGFGSLLLARPAPNGGWTFVGRVGTGFSNQQLRALSRTLAKGGSSKPTIAHTEGAPRESKWIKPTAVAEVYYRGIGNQNLLRQASLKTMRPDKSPDDLRDSDRAPATSKTAEKPRRRKADAAAEEAAPEIRITHPDKVLYPDDGYTKQDVVDYYRAVMDWFLPGVVGRPTSLIRFPEGIGHPSFFQKHIPSGGLHYVGSARLKEETGASAVYLYPKDADSIIELVQYNTLEFHPWGSHVDDPDMADRVVFDLDPGPDVPWERVVAAARLTRKLLKDMGLESFLRTTGGKGLHVVVPLRPASDWDTVKQFAQGFASALAGAHPVDFVAVSTKSIRNKKIFVDYLRNGRGATAVASYSLRGRPGAPVAVPLRWEELGKIRSGAAFDIKSTPERLRRLRRDPWEGIDEVEQSLEAVLQRLGG
jgi:bifunctional non-homologous end joining protein LigD